MYLLVGGGGGEEVLCKLVLRNERTAHCAIDPTSIMADSKELVDLLENRIPEARKSLRDSHMNLENLAKYCETNYVDAGQSVAELEQTKQYAAQSLASVAYQVNMLATGMLELLEKQMNQLGDMEANVHHISQVCQTRTRPCNYRTKKKQFLLASCISVSYLHCAPLP